MKINDIYESTTSGAIATVASPMTTQSRNASIYGGKKGGNLLTGKKTNKKYANSISEGKMKELATDLRDMDNGNFQKKYKKSKEQIKLSLGDPDAKKTVHEAQLDEDDLILVPGQGHRLKSGFIPHEQDRRDHEVEMAKSDLFSAAKNAKQVYEMIADVSEDEGLEGWVQEKIIKANDYLNTIREYLEGKQVQEMTGGVIAGGGVGESLANWNMGVQSIPRTSEWKRKAITAVMPGAMGKEYTFDTEQEAIQHFGKDSWEKIKSGVPTKSGKPWQVIYADDVNEGTKGLWANIHAKRERIKKGSGERMRKPGSKGAPSAQDFKDAANEGVGEKIKGMVRREKAKDMPLVQTRRDYAMGKAGQAYEKGEPRKGAQYSAWAERDRKKSGDPTTNPAGTYRTKTSDYTNEAQLSGDKGKGSKWFIATRATSSDNSNPWTVTKRGFDSHNSDEFKTAWKYHNVRDRDITKVKADSREEAIAKLKNKKIDEAQSMSGALKNTLAKAEPGSKLDQSIKRHNANIKAGQPGTLKNAPTGYHFDKKGYCRLGDK